MAEINWISSTAKNWNDPTAWSGGVVPGVNDIAVLDGTGAGNCTLTGNTVVGGLKILAAYAGTLAMGSYTMTVGNNGVGVFHIFKWWTALDAQTIDLNVDDVLLAVRCATSLVFYADCNLRIAASGGIVGTLNIQSDVTVTLRKTTHPSYPGTTIYASLTHRKGVTVINGILDLTEATTWQHNYDDGLPSFNASAGTIRNTDPNNIVSIAGTLGDIAFGVVTGRFVMNARIYSGTRSITGDMRMLENIVITLRPNYSAATYTMSTAIFSRLQLISETATNVTVRLPNESQIRGDFVVTQASTGTVTLQTSSSGTPRLTAVGTNDQIFDIGNNTVQFAADKPAGNATFSGNFAQTDNSTIRGNIVLNSGSTFSASNYNMTLGGNITDNANAWQGGLLILAGTGNQTLTGVTCTTKFNKPTSDVIVSDTSNVTVVVSSTCREVFNSNVVNIGNSSNTNVFLDCRYTSMKAGATFQAVNSTTSRWFCRGLSRYASDHFLVRSIILMDEVPSELDIRTRMYDDPSGFKIRFDSGNGDTTILWGDGTPYNVLGDLTIGGWHQGNITLVNNHVNDVLYFSQHMFVFQGEIDASQFAGLFNPNGYRYVTIPRDINDIFGWDYDVTVESGQEVDYTGAILWYLLNEGDDFARVTLQDTVGDVTINTGRIDVLAGASFDNRITVNLVGTANGSVSVTAPFVFLDGLFIGQFTTSEDLTLPAGVRIGVLTVTGDGNVTIDLSATNYTQQLVLAMTMDGSLTVIVASFGTINDTKLIVSGQAESIYFSGVGTVILNGDLFVEELLKDNTIIFVTNGFGIFNKPSTFVMVELSSIPVDSNGIPIFQQTSYTGSVTIAPSRMTDLRFSDDIPYAHMQTGDVVVEKYSRDLPVSSMNAVEVVRADSESSEIKSYRNTGHVSFPVNSENMMIVALDVSLTPIEKYVSYRVLAWPLNENGIPIIRVKP